MKQDKAFCYRTINKKKRSVTGPLSKTKQFVPDHEANYPGKRPQTVGGGKGGETSGGDDDDDDTQMRAQRCRHMRAHEGTHVIAHI